MKGIDEVFVKIVFIFLISNLILYFLEKTTVKMRLFHKILSLADTLFLWLLICGYVFYKKPLFVLIPIILLPFEYLIVWAIRTELKKEDISLLVHTDSLIPISRKLREKISIIFFELITFPVFYFEKTWFYERLQSKLEEKCQSLF